MTDRPNRERSRRATLLLAATVVVPLVSAATAEAGNLKGFYTTDAATKDTKPDCDDGGDWTSLPDNGRVTLTLDKGEEIWFAFCNSQRDFNYKFWRVRWEWEDGFISRQSGYDGLDRDGNTVKKIRLEYKKPGDRIREKIIRFKPQPEWERIRFVASADIVNKWLEIDANSICQEDLNPVPDVPIFTCRATIGALGAMIDEGEQTTELWLFPRTTTVDPDGEPRLEAPPHTGPWSLEHVLADPDGTERPLGGVRWLSAGAGLATEELFEATLPILGYVDHRYDLFLFSRERGVFDHVALTPRPWADDFDGYDEGPLAGHGGWEPWDGDPAAAEFLVVSERASSPPHALAIDGADDAVHRYRGLTDGQWQVSASVFVPSAMDDQQHFVLLNTYPAGPDSDWSLQIVIDGAAGLLADRNDPDSMLPLVRDAWTKLRVLVDLDRDEQTVLYEGQHLLTKSWSEGVAGRGALALAALDLYGTESAHPVYYDDVTVREFTPEGACVLPDDGCVDSVDKNDCLADGGTYLGHGSPCPAKCPGDADGNGVVDFADLLRVLSDWGACESCPGDVNGDGLVDFRDLLAVLAAWGPCK